MIISSSVLVVSYSHEAAIQWCTEVASGGPGVLCGFEALAAGSVLEFLVGKHVN